MERTRLLWLILEKHDLFRPGLRVMHAAPELPLAKRYSELLADRYYACDVDAARYNSSYTHIRTIDLCCDLAKLPSRSFDVILHSHVLEHLPCDPEAVLHEFERVLAPGGHHFLSVPISGEETREDLSDELSPAERSMLFGQADHYRIFGRRGFPEMLGRVWGEGEKYHIEALDLFSAEELQRAAIPEAAWSGISSHTIFHHVRPLHQRVSIPAREPQPAKPGADKPDRDQALADFARGERKLILHIGMPKAGTTSLQRWLRTNRDAALRGGLDYWAIAENHSEAMFEIFADPARIAKGAMWFQQDAARSPDPENLKKTFDKFLNALEARTGFVSAEALWSFAPNDVKKLADYLHERGFQPLVLCWIRPPAEFLASAAQQRCRTSLAIGDFGLEFQNKVFIRYRRLDAWIEHFGESHVVALALGEDIVQQLRDLLQQLKIEFAPAEKSERLLNPSISLLAAKALLALNENAAQSGKKQSRRLRAALQDIKGAEFRLPESILRRNARTFEKEADYLAERLALDRNWLLSDSTGIDDAQFFHWSYEEVVNLLRVLSDAFAKLEDKGGSGA